MSQIKFNNQLSYKIQQAQAINKKLSQTLKQLEQKAHTRINEQVSSKRQNIIQVQQQQQKITAAVIKNIEKRIQIYRQQLQKIPQNSPDDYIAKIKQMQQQIQTVNSKNNQYRRQIRIIQENSGVKNQPEYQYRTSRPINDSTIDVGNQLRNLDSLQKKYNTLKNTQISTNKLKPHNKIRILQSPMLHQQCLISSKSSHKQDINKQALYRNLIKYYNNQQIRLKQDIKKLHSEKQKQVQQQRQLQNQIQKCDDQIKRLREKI